MSVHGIPHSSGPGCRCVECEPCGCADCVRARRRVTITVPDEPGVWVKGEGTVWPPELPVGRESAGSVLARLGTDGAAWAREFGESVRAGGMDEGAVISWFANAIEAGREAGYGYSLGWVTLADRHARYLLNRGHVPNQSTPEGQARYVLGEAQELQEAVWGGTATEIRNELADVVLAAVTLAKILGVTVEDCIDEKTAMDRGRG